MPYNGECRILSINSMGSNIGAAILRIRLGFWGYSTRNIRRKYLELEYGFGEYSTRNKKEPPK